MRFFQPEEKRYVFLLIKLYFTPRWSQVEVKKLCWELVFDWMIRRNEQQTSGFLNAATFLVRDAFRALFFTFAEL